MVTRIIFSLFISISAIAQTQTPQQLLDACTNTEPGSALTDNLSRYFFVKEPAGGMRGSFLVASKPIPIAEGSIAAIYVVTQSYAPDLRNRWYAFTYVANGKAAIDKQAHCDHTDVNPEIKVMAGRFLRFRGIFTNVHYQTKEKTRSMRTTYFVIVGDAMKAIAEMPEADLRQLPNMILGQYGITLTPDDIKRFFSGPTWMKRGFEKITAAINADDADLLDYIFSIGPGLHGRTLFKFEIPPDSLALKDAEYARSYMRVRVVIKPVPMNDGLVFGICQSRPYDKDKPFIYRFMFWNSTDGRVGHDAQPNLGPERSSKQFIEATALHEHFLRIKNDGSVTGASPIHYIVLSDRDLYEINGLPREELPFHRNYIFARYGYKFKNPVYQQYFSQYDWYKPLYDNVDAKLTDDDKEIVKLLLEEEKKAPVTK